MGKKLLYVFLGLVAFVLVAAATVPLLFKDDIKAALDKELATSVNAKVYYDADQFSLSVFSNFPQLTVKLGDFGVVNKAPFEGDTLIAVKEFNIVVDLMSVLTGDQIKIRSVLLDQPDIYAMVMPDGTANWQITVPDTTKPAEAPAKEPSKFNIAVNKWEIRNGQVHFIDLQTPMFAAISNLNHTGSGDFSNDLVDLKTNTTIDTMSLEYDSTRYFNRTKVAARFNLKLNQKENAFTFDDNELRLNDFALGFTGNVKLGAEAKVYDLKFNAKETSFKNILSLIPAVFMKGYEDLKTEGNVAFDGFLKGEQRPGILPQIGFNLKVSNGMMQYPKLPSAVTNVNIDFAANHPGGPLEAIKTNLKKFHFELGKNPFDARLTTEGIKRMTLDGEVKTKLNLTEVTQAFPIEGMSLKGLFSLDAKANGVYDATQNLMPTIAAHAELMDGYVKSDKVPAPVEQLAVVADLTIDNGKPETGHLLLEKMRFVLEGETLEATADVKNFKDYTYKATLKGKADLGKLTKIYPLENKTITGKIIADLTTAGNKADVDAKRWDKLPTSGSMGFENFSYAAPSLKQKVTISQGLMNITPQQLTISRCDGKLGSSDYSMTGTISNYLPFVFGDGVVTARMNLTSPKFLASEWVSSSSSADAKAAPTTSQAPAKSVEEETGISIPKSFDVVMNTKINTLLYDKYVLDQFNSTLIVKNGIVSMQPVAFNTLDGTVKMTGTLDPTQPAKTAFKYALDVRQMSIPKTYTTVATAQKLAPFMQKMSGLFNTNINLSGGLDKSLSPDMKSLSGTAEIILNQAAINSLDFPAKVNALAKTNLPTQFSMKDLKVSAVVADGFVNFKPFDLASGANKVNISGRYGLDGTLDYLMRVTVPSGQAGQMAAGALKQFLGNNVNALSNLVVDVKVEGSQTKPTYRVVGVSTAGSNGKPATVQDLGKQAFDKAKQEAEQRARQEADRLKQEAEQRAKQEADRLKQEAERKAKEELNNLKKKFGF